MNRDPIEEASDPTTPSGRLCDLWNAHNELGNPGGDNSVLEVVAKNPNLAPDVIAQLLEEGAGIWTLENPALVLWLSVGHHRMQKAFVTALSCLLATFLRIVPPEPIREFYTQWANYWIDRWMEQPGAPNLRGDPSIFDHPDGCSVVIDTLIPTSDKICEGLKLGREALKLYPDQEESKTFADMLAKFANLAGVPWP